MSWPTIETLIPDSSCLQGFPLSDSRERYLRVYLPPQYEKLSDLPVVFFLSGWGSRSEKWMYHFGAFGSSILESFDREILSGRLKAFVGVFPDGTSRWGHSQYLNSSSNGFFQDYLAESCIDSIQKHFKVSREPEQYLAIGHSSGGFGALCLGRDRPDRFLNICSVAGDSRFELSLLPCVIPACTEMALAGGLTAFLDACLQDPDPGAWSSSRFKALMLLSLAACYAPSDSAPLYGDIFFNDYTGEIDLSVWDLWLRHDPVVWLRKDPKSLSGLRFLLLDAGRFDEYGAQLGHRQMEQLMKPHTKVERWEYNGRHSGQHYRLVDRVRHCLEKMP